MTIEKRCPRLSIHQFLESQVYTIPVVGVYFAVTRSSPQDVVFWLALAAFLCWISVGIVWDRYRLRRFRCPDCARLIDIPEKESTEPNRRCRYFCERCDVYWVKDGWRFRFSLRTLVIAVLIAGVVLGTILQKVNEKRYSGLTVSVRQALPVELVYKERLVDYLVRSTERTKNDMRQLIVEVKPVVMKDGTPALSFRYDKWALGDLPERKLHDLLGRYSDIEELSSEAGQPAPGQRGEPPPEGE